MGMIDDFKASYDNLARPTQFKVSGMGADRSLEFLCKGAQIPAGTIGTIEVPTRGGRKVKEPGDRTYAPWTITIMNDNDFTLRTFFENWQNSINSPAGNIGPNSSEAIKFDAFVEQLDSEDNTIATYQFTGTWPSELSPIELSFETTDTIEEFTVTLEYDYWDRV